MTEWEYITINLSDLPLKTEALDLLNDAGKDGWELVGMASNNMAYLKRQIGMQISARARKPTRSAAK